MFDQLKFGKKQAAPQLPGQKQRDLYRAEAMAKILAKPMVLPGEGSMVSGHWIPPSATAGLAAALDTYAGMDAANKLADTQYEAQQEVLEEQARTQREAQEQLARGFSAMGGSNGGQPQWPLLPGRTAQESYQIAQGIGLPAYLKMYGEQSNQKPINVAPGGILVDPVSKTPVFSAAQNGVQTQYGPEGPYAQAIPGYANASAHTNAQIAGAQTNANEQAKAAFDITQVPNGNGDMISMPRTRALEVLKDQENGMGRTEGAENIQARKHLQKVESAGEMMLDTIDKVMKHPGKAANFGVRGTIPNITGTAARDFEPLKEQLSGQAFLQAFNELKGGGAITQTEALRAEAAVARLAHSQTVESFNDAMEDLRKTVRAGIARAKAEVKSPEQRYGRQETESFSHLWE